jgi:flagellar biosynthesis chaperone FliJ
MRALLAMGYALQEIETRFQELEEQVRDFPEQLRRERATASAQVEELHSRAVATFADKSVDLDKRMQQEARRADEAESELKAVRDHCSSLESQLQSSSNSVLTLQMQLSKTDGDWRRELDAMQQQLQELASQADTMSGELQAQAARADAATAKWREAEAEVQQCRHVMQLDAGRLQVLNSCGASALCVLLLLFHTCHIACVLCSRWVMLCRKSKQGFRSWKSKCGTSPSSCGARGQLQAPKLKSCTRVRLQPLRTNPLIWTSACSRKLGVQTRLSLS